VRFGGDLFGGSLKGKEGGPTPLESLVNRFRCRAEPAPFIEAIKSYAQKEK
jgi:hypothetical protein